VYNFTVDGEHTYFVGDANGGAWVHNSHCVVDGLDEGHIFHGEIGNDGLGRGFHYEGGNDHIGKARSANVVSPPNAQGVYVVEVEIFNPATNSWVPKKPQHGSGLSIGRSTMYPRAWSKQRVIDEIWGAFANSHMLNSSTWEGMSPSGVKIRGFYRSNGNNGRVGDIITAYPIY
jgi:hypothetical protein